MVTEKPRVKRPLKIELKEEEEEEEDSSIILNKIPPNSPIIP